MAAATSAPELFVNVIGTFITEGDIGVGTIVGSAVFNILAVAACCGIGAGMVSSYLTWNITIGNYSRKFIHLADNTLGLVAIDTRQHSLWFYRGRFDLCNAR